MRFILATGNSHKLTEFRRILAPHEVVAMPAGLELPPEGTESFAANARGKAEGLALTLAASVSPSPAAADVLYLADDSGLEVEVLGWAPGVTSARYAGVDGPGADGANVARLLRELAGFAGPVARRARFVCSVVALAPDGRAHEATGQWWGAIAEAPRGAGGFGYDPVFVPDGSELTVAEWPAEAKDQASHRARAGKALVDLLRRDGVLDGR